MTVLLAPLAPNRHGFLARANPVAKLLAAAVLLVVLLASVDPVTPALALAVELLALPFLGVAARTLLHRAAPLLLGAAGVALVNALFGERGDGSVLVSLGPVTVSTVSALAGVALGLRVLAIALPGIVVLAATDPVDLADSLVQQARMSPRFAYAALAALRLLPLVAADWQILARAQRARGIEPGRSPVAHVRQFAAQVFALLVAAVRRGTRLALAMDARGFGTGPRTSARRQQVRRADALLVAAALLLGVAATATSVALGTWQPLFG